ncbi:MAG: carboxypeptidase M32 [Pirellulales bacterium]|nr:carboxypeptidase M32 [Pirellulales bacterium]
MSQNFERLFDDVCHHARRAAMLTSISALLEWDERVYLPAAGSEYRAEECTYLAGMMHERWIDAKFGDSLAALAESPLAVDPASDAAVVVRRLKHQRDKKIKLPQSLVEELARTAVLGQHAWQEARKQNNFGMFRPLLEKTIDLKKQQAEALGYADCPYDALLDDFEPDERTANIRRALRDLREQLVPLVAAIGASAKRPKTEILKRPFPVAQQEAFGKLAAAAIGFDFEAGRVDVTAHPFCTTLGPRDCRITTRYHEDFFPAAFFGTLHEAGHGMYEQGLPAENYGLPTGEAISLGVHESQSRMWENLVGRSKSFWKFFYPEAKKQFPQALDGVSLDDFYFAVNDVRPSLVRIEADEATYNLHILIRFELEQDLLDGKLAAADAAEAWRDRYRQYLGVGSPTDADGVLQDVHWSAGLFGYFPTYSLGNLYAAQYFEQARKELGDLDAMFARGEFRPLLDWLRANIHRHGQCYTAAELVERVTGKPLSHEPLMRHLRGKFGELYGV